MSMFSGLLGVEAALRGSPEGCQGHSQQQGTRTEQRGWDRGFESPNLIPTSQVCPRGRRPRWGDLAKRRRGKKGGRRAPEAGVRAQCAFGAFKVPLDFRL